MAVTHIIDERRHWRIWVEPTRHRPPLNALIPKESSIADVMIFADAVTVCMRRKLAELEKGRNHGETQGQGESAVRGEDAAGPPEKKEDPQGGGPQGGSDPKA